MKLPLLPPEIWMLINNIKRQLEYNDRWGWSKIIGSSWHTEARYAMIVERNRIISSAIQLGLGSQHCFGCCEYFWKRHMRPDLVRANYIYYKKYIDCGCGCETYSYRNDDYIAKYYNNKYKLLYELIKRFKHTTPRFPFPIISLNSIIKREHLNDHGMFRV